MKQRDIIRFIGDTHGWVNTYTDIIKRYPKYSIQMGDFGFEYEWKKLVETVDGNFHKILAGNHDDYDYIRNIKPIHNLGDFGEYTVDNTTMFFVRGGLSIDKHLRIQGKSWWMEEELDFMQQSKCIQKYKKVKPDFVITHVPPECYLEELHEDARVIQSTTGQLLSMLYEIHQPKLWIYAHMHPQKTFINPINNTNFICLAIKDYIDYDLKITLDENIECFKNTIIETLIKR